MTTPAPPAIAQRYAAARQALEGGAPLQAKAQLEALLQLGPRFAPAHHLMGLCLAELGDLAGAERALRQAAALDKRLPAVHTTLGDLFAETGRASEAERSYRAALMLDRRWLGAAVGLSRLLGMQGRFTEALQITTPLVAPANAPPPALEAHTRTLVAAGRREDALASSRRAAAAGVPDADLGTAQLLTATGRHEEAEEACRAILRQRPDDERAQRGLARTIFARTRDADAACAVVDQALAHRWSPTHVAFKAYLLNLAGRSPEAYALLREAIGRSPDDAGLHASAAKAAVFSQDFEAGYAYAERAQALGPPDDELQLLMAEASLGAGRPDRAAALIQPLRQAKPLDQKLIAFGVLAQRLAGDDRYRELYDYGRFVRAYTLEPPRGWPSLDAFLSDLRGRLHEIHESMTDPMDQSVRQGTQTNVNLVHTTDPVLKSLFGALDRPVADYVAQLGRSDDPLQQPLRARNLGGHAYHSAWSVRLRPGGGHHLNHIHPEGWLSSAFYVDLPSVMDGDGREGWLKFGEPGVPTLPALEAEHHVRPEAGKLVLFPSYMWHGTTPFSGNERRLTFAFDVIPAARR